MNHGSNAFHESKAYESGPLSRTSLPQNILGGAALAFIALACAWSVHASLFEARVDPVVVAQPIAPAESTMPESTVQIASTSVEPTPPPTDPDTYALLFVSSYSAGSLAGALAGGVPDDLGDLLTPPPASLAAIAITQDVSPLPPTAHRLVQSVPMPAPRPAELRPPSRNPSLHAMAHRNKATSNTADDKPTIFERLFGKPKPAGQTLAYAAPDGGVAGDGQSLPSGRSGLYDRWTAVYDISARTVYMPDGTKLEAHSGLGSRLDDPRYVHEKMRGATPPHVYELELRERLFHGVRALRLIPVGGEGNVFGRRGLLAHTYMLGPNGDSNGCVSFRNYNAFLRAYENREIKRLVVVARLD